MPQATTPTATSESPFKPIVDVFHSNWVRASFELVLFAAVALHLATAFYAYKDARRRIEDPVLVAVSVAAAFLFPLIGVLVYMILRPPEYLDDVRERELEIRAMERRLGGDARCPTCRSEIEPSFLSCPVCTTRLKSACRRCKSPLDPRWRICPYCETEPREPEGADASTFVSVPRTRRSRS